MLALTRRIGEELVLDGGVRVVIVGVHGSGVRLGLIKPSAGSADRSESDARGTPGTARNTDPNPLAGGSSG